MNDSDKQSARKRWFAASTALLGWFGLALQLSVVIDVRRQNGLDITPAIINFLSYFTIWTNLLVSVALTCVALNLRHRYAQALTRPMSMTGIATCIALVGLAYHFLLRGLWRLIGTHLLANNILHYVEPALFLTFWWLFVAPARMGWRDAMQWALFPAIYLAFALLRGAVSGWYAYPFINAAEIGYVRVLVNALGVSVGFSIIAGTLIWLDRRKR